MGYLFRDVIPKRNFSQRYLIKLTREESILVGFLYPVKNDRNTWGETNIIHIYFINTKSIILEYNKG